MSWKELWALLRVVEAKPLLVVSTSSTHRIKTTQGYDKINYALKGAAAWRMPLLRATRTGSNVYLGAGFLLHSTC